MKPHKSFRRLRRPAANEGADAEVNEADLDGTNNTAGGGDDTTQDNTVQSRHTAGEPTAGARQIPNRQAMLAEIRRIARQTADDSALPSPPLQLFSSREVSGTRRMAPRPEKYLRIPPLTGQQSGRRDRVIPNIFVPDEMNELIFDMITQNHLQQSTSARQDSTDSANGVDEVDMANAQTAASLAAQGIPRAMRKLRQTLERQVGNCWRRQ